MALWNRCGLAGVGVVLLKEVCHLGVGIEVLYAQTTPSVAHSPLLLPVDQDVELSAPSPACHHVFRHDDTNLNL